MPEESTFFAEAGRVSGEELAEQVRRSYDDPCVQAILEAVDGYLLILNEQRQILAANQEVLQALHRDNPSYLVGLRPGEAMNCAHFTEGPDGCGTSVQCRGCGAVLAILASQKSGTTSIGECRMSALVGGQLAAQDFRVHCTPLTVAGHPLTAFLLQDISSAKRREVLEQTFLHDLLNSIGGIEGWSTLLNQSGAETAAREILLLAETLKDSVLSQQALLQAEQGELVATREVWPAQGILDRLRTLFNGHPLREGRHMLIDAAPEDALVRTDRAILLRVLTNMVKNAFEATAPGGAVRVRFEWRDGAPAFVVHNPGTIGAAVRPHLFERSFSTKAKKGRGIGAYSMKLFGERYLGGAVSYSSDEVSGTSFQIVLPPDEAVAGVAQPGAPEASASQAPRLLLAEDDEPIRRLAAMFLKRLGFDVTACADGEEAERVFRASPGKFDLVITDARMPRMDGVELTRNLLELRPDLAVVLCSGAACDERTEQAVRDGIFSGVISKPFSMKSIAQVLETAWPGVSNGGAATRR